MNPKLSGAQLVLVPIKRVGKNYFPWVENLRDRFIKYIDFYGAKYLPGTDVPGLEWSDGSLITITNAAGNTQIIRNLPLERLDYRKTLGVRQPIASRVCLSDCYVECFSDGEVGKMAAFVFWYDLPDYSKANSTDSLIIDSVSIPLTTPVRYNQFPDIDRMTGKRFRRLLVSAQNTTPDLYAGLDVDKLENIYLTLRKGTYNVLENVPVMLLYQLAMIQKTEFANIIFDFQSSFLTIGGAGTIPNVDEDYIGKSVFFNLQYEK